MDNLEFQDLPYEQENKNDEQTHTFSDFPPDATEDQPDDTSRQQESKSESSPSMFSLAFYQQFFDVDTLDVLNRILGSMVPNIKRNYLEHVIRPKPDLYGPFWICATLTFSIAISGNIASFYAASEQGSIWRYDFQKVPLAATAIFCYWLIIPIAIWGILKWRGSLAGYLLTEVICIYGYSLAIFVPISVLWLINVVWVQWSLVIVGSLLSGVTLLITFWPAVKNDKKQVAVGFLFIIMILHAALASGFVLYFFSYNHSSTAVTTSQPPSQLAPAVAQTDTKMSVGPSSKNQSDKQTAQNKPNKKKGSRPA